MAVGRILAGIFILSLFAVTVSSQEECLAKCDGIDDWIKVDDPYNCTKYYTCYNSKPLDHSTPCPNGGTFAEGECGPPTDPPCKPECSEVIIDKCSVICLNDVSRINDPSNCGTYYDCDSNVPGPARQCKDINPYYDSQNDICVKDKSVCCTFNCEPVCEEVDTFIPDYYDSTKFYLCQFLGTPSEDFHFQCAEGENFDFSVEACGPFPKWQSSCSTSSSSSIVTAPVTPSSIVTGSTTPSSIVTGSTSLSSIVTSPVTTTSGCMDSMTCAGLGYFPKCDYCDPEYFFCEQIGQPAVVQRCSGVLLFSPLQHLCVLPAGCT